MTGKLLLTGASGYIGGKLARHFLDQGASPRLFVRVPERLNPWLKDACEIAVGDLTQPETLMNALHGVSAVIHSAGLLGRWGLPYNNLFEVNVKGTEALVRATCRQGVARFIHLSAGGVTGPLGSLPVDETYPPRPRTDYERSKWEGEQRALVVASSENINLLVVRPTFTYGPGDPHKLDLFRAVKNGRFAFIGDGESTVHPVYIDDLLRGVDLALKSDLKGTSVIIGGPRPVTKRELVWGIADALGVNRPQRMIPVGLATFAARACELAAAILRFQPPLTQSRVLTLSRNWGYNCDKAARQLGYQPQVDLAQGLQKTVAWYRERGWL